MSLTALPSHVDGLLLDLDGTLVDTEHLHYESTNTVLAGYGKHLSTADFMPFIGWSERPFWDALRARFALAPSVAELAAERSRVLVVLLRQSKLEPLPGVIDLLRWALAHGVPCAIASSSLRVQIEASVQGSGIAGFVKDWASGYDDVTRGKPFPDVYIEAARRIGVDPRRCLAIEDSATGIASAKAAGAFVVAVPCVSHPDLSLGEADLRLSSIIELLPLLAATRGPGGLTP